MSRTAAALLCLALVALAGCNAFVGGDSATSPTAEDAVTPAPVPTTAVPFPPGVAERRVDAATLAAAHASALRTRNYTVAVRESLVGANGTISELTRRRVVAAGGDRYGGGYERSVPTPAGNYTTADVAYWASGTSFTTSVRTGERDPYYGYSKTNEPILDVDGSLRVNRTLGAIALRATDRTPDGVVLTGGRVTAPGRIPTPSYVVDPHNVSTTVRVRFDGVVTDWRLAYDARLRGDPVRVVQRFRVFDIDATAVERPDWVSGAIRNSSAGPS